MSFLVGTISGALVAGGVYYGFSNTIETRTKQLRRGIHAVSHRFELDSAQAMVPTASDRITHRPFSTLLQGRWNQQVDSLFKTVAGWDRHAAAWVRRALYGGDAASKENTAKK
ncbi:hypothetical protein BJ322DRAFT_1079981 [Thelephora terrestris]|uniref:Found in mitochondrial proteome protein 51 n=1 Tax=Thelephora terrestris TaxID=56493 RepID=A0A9P6H805_9AGAM|nr:hypothetical protein BJ322DRAFT_1079981 [Thelephora terrestris]